MVSKTIRATREKLGLSQQLLAAKVKLSGPGGMQYLSNFERGVSTISPVHLKNICKTLGLNYNEIAAEAVNDMTAAYHERIKSKFGVS